MAMDFSLSFDMLLACFFPLALFLIAIKTSRAHRWTWRDIQYFLSVKSLRKPTHGLFSLENAHQSYAQYKSSAGMETNSRWASFNSLGRAHKRLANTIGYPAKLGKLKNVTDLNAVVTQKIAALAAKEFSLDDTYGGGRGDLGRVREALKHFIRDWSADGSAERQKIFSPILNVLKAVEPIQRKDQRILVPGSGLGRLAWEISQLGYDTTANELSYFMNLAFRFLLSEQTTTSTDEHVLCPYAHWFSHQLSNDSLFRAIRFPDVVPRLSQNFRLAETDFLKLLPPHQIIPSSDRPAKPFWSKSQLVGLKESQPGYDYVVTLFFLDTSLNVLTTMEHIYTLLRPGGTWINLGPLLWTSGGQSKLELSLEEVVHAAEEVGFIIQDGDPTSGDIYARQTVECEYTGDPNAMMRWIYKAEFWVATKPK